MQNTDLQQRCYNYANVIQQIPSTCVGSVVGFAAAVNRAEERSNYITDYIKEKNLKNDSFTRKNVTKELVKTNKISSKCKTIAIPFAIAFIGTTLIYEAFKRNIFNFKKGTPKT